jgi:Flp pilus assembly protein TadD
VQVAAAREQEEDWEGLVDALHRANEELATTPQVWRSLGLVLDLRLGRTAEAAEAYRQFLELGGADPLVDERLAALVP